MTDARTRRQPSGRRWPSVLLAFARIGATSFGGGSATIAAMRETCRRRGWLTEAEFLDTVVLSRLTPGITILAQVLLIGRSVAGVRGMVAGVLGMMAPSIAITITLAWLYERVAGLPQAAAPLGDVAAVAAGFAVALALQLLRDTVRRGPVLRGAVLFVVYLGVALVISNPLIVMGIAVAAGLLVPVLFDAPEHDGSGDAADERPGRPDAEEPGT
jgi:chromate transporter